MDPQLKSILTTVLAAVLGGAGVWAVKVGVVPVSAQADVVNALVTVVIGVIGAGVTWWKARQASPAGLVQSLGNTDPKKVADAVDAAPPATKAAIVDMAVKSDTIPTGEKK